MSVSSTNASLRRPAVNRPGQRQMSGTRVRPSKKRQPFWRRPWSPADSPWSLVKMTTVRSACPAASSASSSRPNCSSTSSIMA